LIVNPYVAVNNRKLFSVAMEMQVCVTFTLLSSYTMYRIAVTNRNIHTSSRKMSDFSYTWSFSTAFRKSSQYQIARYAFKWETR